MVLLVVGTAVAWRGGADAVVPQISDIGAWLSNSGDGSVVHVNGLSGAPDAHVPLHDAEGHPLEVIQDGDTVVVVDTVTGVVSRVDPAQLIVSQMVEVGTGSQVVIGHGEAYLIETEHGGVQRIDLADFSAVGSPLRLNQRVGRAGVDRDGTLWIPAPASGQIVPVADGAAGTAVIVGRPGDALSLTIAGGTPVVTNATRSTMIVVGAGRAQVTINLPGSNGGGRPRTLLPPASTEAAVVPVVVAGAGELILVDTRTGTPTSVTLAGTAGDDLGVPAILGGRVYVPNHTTGSLIVYDSGAGRLLDQIPVSDQPGRLDVFVKDGLVWANDADGPDAVSVDGSGKVTHIGKYDQRPSETATPTRPPAPQAQPGSATAAAPPTRASPQTPAGPAVPPGSVTQTAQAGSVLVTFTPASSGAVTHYTLAGLPAGATASPSHVPSSGPYRFTVDGLACDREYSFSVVAHYPGTSAATDATAGARPCVAPGPPRNLSLDSGTQHQVRVTWSAPANDGGAPVTYTVSWGAGEHAGLSGTSDTIAGLTNFQTYTITVTARNPAGASQPPATATTSLRPRSTWGGTVTNTQFELYVRQQPTTESIILHVFPAGSGQAVSVVCLTSGGSWVDPTGSPSGNTWYRVSSPANGFVAAGYVDTSSGVWSCS